MGRLRPGDGDPGTRAVLVPAAERARHERDEVAGRLPGAAAPYGRHRAEFRNAVYRRLLAGRRRHEPALARRASGSVDGQFHRGRAPPLLRPRPRRATQRLGQDKRGRLDTTASAYLTPATLRWVIWSSWNMGAQVGLRVWQLPQIRIVGQF